MRSISTATHIKDIARGAVFLGTGGGGDPYVGELFLYQQLSKGKTPIIFDASELKDDDFVISIAGIGAPTVLIEHLASEKTMVEIFARCEKFYGKKIDAIISAEIGGANSMFPLALSAILGVPVVDGDGMGRAFPHIEMTVFSIYGCLSTPGLFMDELGNCGTVEASTDETAEHMLRALATSLGSMIVGGFFPMTGAQVKELAVLGTITQTLEIGEIIRTGREKDNGPFLPLMDYLNDEENGRHAKILFDGKIIDVTHETRDGWHWGTAKIVAMDDPEDEMIIEIQNEYTIARRNGRTVAVVPDLISVLDRETAEPLTAEMLIYGLRVKVVGYGAAPVLRRPECLAVCGPRSFGIDEDFHPIEELS